MDEMGKYFQVGVSALLVFFALFNLIRTFVQTSDVFLTLCFTALLMLAWCLFKLSWKELRGETNINDNEEDEI